MSSKAYGLLAQIEAGVIDGEPLSTLLQKVILLGGRAESAKMREWARQELNGYDGDNLPPYRHLHVPLYARLTNPAGYNAIEQRIPPHVLHEKIRELTQPERLSLGTGVGELEAMVAAAAADPAQDPHRLSPTWGDLLGDWLQEHHIDKSSTKVSAVYFQVPNASIMGLLVQVRTALAELVADLVSTTPEGEEPSQGDADRAVNFIVTGERATVTYTSQHTSSGSNISAPGAKSAVVATDDSTAIGSQVASGMNSAVVGTQSADGDHATLAGRDNPTALAPKEEPAGFWTRLRKRGLLVALFTVIAGAVAVFTWIGWSPW